MKHGVVQFGLIGYGLFGKHHAHAIALNEGSRLVAVAAPSQASRDAARQAYPSSHVTGDYREVLSREDIDAVSIVAPNDLHYEMAAAALRAGKHVFLEKPMALSAAECDELVALADTGGLVLAVNHELRVSALWGGVRKLIDDGAIGPPRYAMIELSRFPYRRGSGGWRYDRQRVGDWILEEPIHFFDLARWYLQAAGEPVSVYARASGADDDTPDLFDNFAATVNFGGGAFAVIAQTLAAFEHHVTAKVAGPKGTIWARWSAPDARSDKPVFELRHGRGDDIHEVPLPPMTGELVELREHLAAFTRCVRGGGSPPCTGRDGAWSAKLCLAAGESVRSGQPVNL